MQKTSLLLSLVILFLFPCFISAPVYGQTWPLHQFPFSTNETNITIWNGENYEPFFLKGMNLGVAVPGKFPGELEVSSEQYAAWFQLIKDAGFNSIRLYTLHYPHFYEVLDAFNQANPDNPLFFFQGVWLEEEMEGFTGDLYFLTDAFTNEIEENVDCVHGNRFIEPRLGKAHGDYQTDVSKWNIGYIIGREIHPGEVLVTNYQNSQHTAFTGNHFGIGDVLPTEAWAVSKLDHLVSYEYNNYNTQRPVSFSSWPTQDPLIHPEEWNPWEDTTSVDLSTIQFLDAPARYFASYHAYPYYPDFINYGPDYQDFSDNYGPNSYMGYLTHLKEYYHRFPLIIAEYGVPSSWGVAHYSTSGMHHGGFDDYEQGENNIRILKSIESAGCGGGIQFSWIDEWFKRTWVTDHIDYLMNRRILWHNITAAEQNFGLVGFQRSLQMELWDEFCEDCDIQSIEASADYDFFHLKLYLKNMLNNPDEMWISLDTYDAGLGESVMPAGDTLENRAEFALHLTNYSAKLYVTQAYDLYGIFHGISEPEQQYHSVVSDGAPWNIVRWKVNEFDQDVQYIGNMKVNYGFLPYSSKDAVTIFEDHVHIRIPWSLIHFVDPSEYVVFHDDRSTPQPEDTISDGISVSVFYKDEVFTPEERYLWANWNTALDVEEVLKGSYWVMKDRLQEFNNRAIAQPDTFHLVVSGEPVTVGAQQGVLGNDFDLDGGFMQALLLDPPQNGRVELGQDGSFIYEPGYGKNLQDSFTYIVFDGYSLSQSTRVQLNIDVETSIADNFSLDEMEKPLLIYPNPAHDAVAIEMTTPIDFVTVFDMGGRMMKIEKASGSTHKMDVSGLIPGSYFIKINSPDKKYVRKINVF